MAEMGHLDCAEGAHQQYLKERRNAPAETYFPAPRTVLPGEAFQSHMPTQSHMPHASSAGQLVAPEFDVSQVPPVNNGQALVDVHSSGLETAQEAVQVKRDEISRHDK